MADGKKDAIYKADTVPPPADSPNDAPTKVGPVTAEAWLALMREANKQAPAAAPSPPATETRKVGKADLSSLIAQVEGQLRAPQSALEPTPSTPTPITPSNPQLDPALVTSSADENPPASPSVATPSAATPSVANDAPRTALFASASPSEKHEQTRRATEERPPAIRAVLLFVLLLSVIALACSVKMGLIPLRFR
jgi:hypothetical protein